MQFSEVRAGGSYISQNDPRLHFGLGADVKMDEVEIRWPSGKVEVLRDVPADFIYTIVEGQGIQSKCPCHGRKFSFRFHQLPQRRLVLISLLLSAVRHHTSGGRCADLRPRHGLYLIDRAELLWLALLVRHPTHLAIACMRQSCNN